MLAQSDHTAKAAAQRSLNELGLFSSEKNIDENEVTRFSFPHISWTTEAQEAIATAIKSGWISISANVEELEQVCGELFGVDHVIACSSATQGLSIAVQAANWKGSTVAVPAFTWPSTLYALQTNHCNVVFADLDPDTWLMDPGSMSESVDYYMPVDVFGNQWLADPGDDTPVIMDAAHGFNLPLLGKRGLFEVVSLSHTKIPTAGEGGLILTQDAGLADQARELRRLASRMNEFCAIVALESIRQYEEMVEQRAQIMAWYDSELKIPFIRQKIESATSASVYALRISDRALRRRISIALDVGRVEYKIYYDPLTSGLPHTDCLYSEILCLPVYPKIKKHLPYITSLINRCI